MRRVKTQASLQCAETVGMLLWALRASGRITTRKESLGSVRDCELRPRAPPRHLPCWREFEFPFAVGKHPAPEQGDSKAQPPFGQCRTSSPLLRAISYVNR
jgi:hypothetical protein